MFTHLATRSCYSLRHGALRPDELAEAVAARGMEAVGVADRDGLVGAVRLTRACEAAGVRPILGVDLALRPDPGRPGWAAARDRGGYAGPGSGPAWLDDRPARVVLLARNPRGYTRLCQAVTDAHLHAERGAPRVSWAALADRLGGGDRGGAGDVLVLLGDDSPPARLLDAGRADAAVAETRRWAELVGPSNLLVGVTHHWAPGDDARARARFDLADRLGLPAVAHQDARYRDAADARLVDLLDALREQTLLSPHQRTRRNAEGYLKTPEEMAAVFAERPDALTNAAAAAERCEPALALPEPGAFAAVSVDLAGAGAQAMPELRARCAAGLAHRLPGAGAAYHERLEVELDTIAQLGLAAYFLTVADVVARIREKGIAVACRGSAAGSLVAYALRISDVDPVAHGLLAERFMGPYRDELPDIDLDVESARREDIYRDLRDRYGEERVAGLTMIETFQGRSAIREVGKALGCDAGEIDRLATALPRLRGRDVRGALDRLPELPATLRSDALGRAGLGLLLEAVERLDGLPRHLALHPSGVLLADHDLRAQVPLQRSAAGERAGDALAAGFAMAQVDKDDVTDLGLCKLDILGVRMLSSMAHGLEEIRRVRGAEIDLDAVGDGDPATYRLIRSSRTIGCFQIESPGQRELLARLQPERLDDLVVDISLFRPGPVQGDMVAPYLARRAHGGGAAPHPVLAEVLAETHGVIVYHEQLMRALAAVTGCDLDTADWVRRHLAHPDRVERLRAWVLASARRRGIEEADAAALWELFAEFASFGFCKAHAAAFAVPTYRSAWLKAHYLPELIAGLLTHDPGMYPRRLLLEEARQFGVTVLPLDVHRSDRVYRVERVPADEALCRLGVEPTAQPGDPLPDGWRWVDGRPLPAGAAALATDPGADPDRPGERFGIRLALQDVAGIDDATIDRLLAARPFSDLEDLRRRGGLPAPVAEGLAEVGALDGLAPAGASRRDLLLEVAERWGLAARPSGTRRAARPGRSRQAGEQLTLLGPGEPAGLAGPSPAEQVRAELAVLGLDASTHLLRFYESLLPVLGVTRAADLAARPHGVRVRLAGVKVATQTPPVRSGQRVVFCSLDDATGVSDVAIFEQALERCAATVFHGWLLVVEGLLRRSGPTQGTRGLSLTVERAWDLIGLWHAWRRGALAEALDADPTASLADADTPAHRPTSRLWHASGGSAGR